MKRIFTKWKEEIGLLFGLLAVCFFYSISGIGCPVKWLTGISCAGCGMTRAVFYAARLQFGKAFYYHPLFFLPPICAAAMFFRERIPKKAKKYMVWPVIICFLAVYVWRLLDPDCPVVVCEMENGWIARIWNYFKT